MNTEFKITCPVCKVERSTNKANYVFHTKKGGTGKCKSCYLNERNNSEQNKRNFVNGKPVKQHPYYHVWRNMIRRCCDPKTRNYKNYGGRGISICDDWKSSKLFLQWVDSNGEIPAGYELDRRNNNGNYEPNNCRFVPPAVNSQNRRSTKLTPDQVVEIRHLNIKDELLMDEAVEKYGVTHKTLLAVIQKRTWKNIKEVCQ